MEIINPGLLLVKNTNSGVNGVKKFL